MLQMRVRPVTVANWREVARLARALDGRRRSQDVLLYEAVRKIRRGLIRRAKLAGLDWQTIARGPSTREASAPFRGPPETRAPQVD